MNGKDRFPLFSLFPLWFYTHRGYPTQLRGIWVFSHLGKRTSTLEDWKRASQAELTIMSKWLKDSLLRFNHFDVILTLLWLHILLGVLSFRTYSVEMTVATTMFASASSSKCARRRWRLRRTCWSKKAWLKHIHLHCPARISRQISHRVFLPCLLSWSCSFIKTQVRFRNYSRHSEITFWAGFFLKNAAFSEKLADAALRLTVKLLK